MNKHDLIRTIFLKTGLKQQDITSIVNAVFDEMTDALMKREKVMITNFGTFEAGEVKAFDIYSPYDGALLKNVKQVRVTFKSSSHLKKQLGDNSPK